MCVFLVNLYFVIIVDMRWTKIKLFWFFCNGSRFLSELGGKKPNVLDWRGFSLASNVKYMNRWAVRIINYQR